MPQEPQSSRTLTIGQYYGALGTGFAAIAIALLPFAPLLDKDVLSLLFPPLGDYAAVGKSLSLLLVVGSTFFAFFQKDSSRKRIRDWVLRAFVVAILSVVVYFFLQMSFVRRIPIPSSNDVVLVSIGYTRTPFAQDTFPGATDLEMLQHRGLTDEEINRLWTSSSVRVARAGLWLTYSVAQATTVLFFSLFIVSSLKGKGST